MWCPPFFHKNTHTHTFIYTYDEQSKSMFDQSSTTTEKRDNKHDDSECNQNINANIVSIDVEDLYPILKARINSNPDCESK